MTPQTSPSRPFGRTAGGCCWLAGLLVSASCAVENGDGTLQGTVNVPACTFPGGQARPLSTTGTFDEHWRFFRGEPFDSTTPRYPANQINIRMQRTSARWEFADAITFWVLDSYEAARCMRHRVNADGTNDWNPAYCDGAMASLGPMGEGRMLVGTEGEKVRSHLFLPDSCPDAPVSADALGSCAGGSCPPVTVCPGRNSWIAFSQFGSPPADLTQPVFPGFKVNNGESIRASAFHVELCDEATVDAQQALMVPLPGPAITGILDGAFSFVLNP